MQLRKEIGREEYAYEEGDRFANGDIDVFYEGNITLTKHRSGIVSILFNTKHRWVSYSVCSGYEPKEQIEFIGLQCSHDDMTFEDYHEDFEIVWPKDLLGEMKEYRQLSEQNKDQIEVFFVPWDMLGIQRYLSK